MSEALIHGSTNPQYDKRLFLDLLVQYMKTTSSEHVVYTNCFLSFFWHSEQFMYTTCSELVVFMYWTSKSMNNLLSYCGLVDPRISASDKDLPVLNDFENISTYVGNKAWLTLLLLCLLICVAIVDSGLRNTPLDFSQWNFYHPHFQL